MDGPEVVEGHTDTGDEQRSCGGHPFRDMLGEMPLPEQLRTLLDFARVDLQAPNPEDRVVRRCKGVVSDVAFRLLAERQHLSAFVLFAAYNMATQVELAFEHGLGAHPDDDDPVRMTLLKMYGRFRQGNCHLEDLLET